MKFHATNEMSGVFLSLSAKDEKTAKQEVGRYMSKNPCRGTYLLYRDNVLISRKASEQELKNSKLKFLYPRHYWLDTEESKYRNIKVQRKDRYNYFGKFS